jgi:hypothetical protein
MSSPNYADYLVRQEQYKELLREAKQERMVKVFGPRPGWYRVVARWSGAQVMKYRSTLWTSCWRRFSRWPWRRPAIG